METIEVGRRYTPFFSHARETYNANFIDKCEK